jgi:hypothetical protein
LGFQNPAKWIFSGFSHDWRGSNSPPFADKRLFKRQRPFSAAFITAFSPEHITRNFSAGVVGYAQPDSPAPFLRPKEHFTF